MTKSMKFKIESLVEDIREVRETLTSVTQY